MSVKEVDISRRGLKFNLFVRHEERFWLVGVLSRVLIAGCQAIRRRSIFVEAVIGCFDDYQKIFERVFDLRKVSSF